MPTGPKGQKRLADVIGNAVKVNASPRARKMKRSWAKARTRGDV